MATKIAQMEKLLATLAEAFGLSTTQVAQALLKLGIKSWDDLKSCVEEY